MRSQANYVIKALINAALRLPPCVQGEQTTNRRHTFVETHTGLSSLQLCRQDGLAGVKSIPVDLQGCELCALVSSGPCTPK